MKIVLLFVLLVSSCCPRKDFFKEKLDDGSDIHASEWFCKKSAHWYIVAGRSNKKEGLHDEYYIPTKRCDTLTKKVFKNRGVKIFLLVHDSNPQYPITKEDWIIFKKIAAVPKGNDSCFSTFINTATGYKLVVDIKNIKHKQ